MQSIIHQIVGTRWCSQCSVPNLRFSVVTAELHRTIGKLVAHTTILRKLPFSNHRQLKYCWLTAENGAVLHIQCIHESVTKSFDCHNLSDLFFGCTAFLILVSECNSNSSSNTSYFFNSKSNACSTCELWILKFLCSEFNPIFSRTSQEKKKNCFHSCSEMSFFQSVLRLHWIAT